REVVGDPVRKKLRLRPVEDLAGMAVDVALDTAARHGPRHLAVLGDAELRAHRPRGRTARGDHRREREPLAALAPALDVADDLLHAACLPWILVSTAASSSRLARLCPATKRSTYGSAARMPPASG